MRGVNNKQTVKATVDDKKIECLSVFGWILCCHCFGMKNYCCFVSSLTVVFVVVCETLFCSNLCTYCFISFVNFFVFNMLADLLSFKPFSQSCLADKIYCFSCSSSCKKRLTASSLFCISFTCSFCLFLLTKCL